MKTIANMGEFYHSLVREFVVTLVSSINELGCPDFHKVRVRRTCFNFSLKVINTYLNISVAMSDWSAPNISDILLALTGGINKYWPRKGQLSVTMLRVKYAILPKIGLANWTPSSHSSRVSPSLENLLFQLGTGVHVDFETFIYDQIVRHANSITVKPHISFPHLISGLLVSQHLKILTSKDVASPSLHLLDVSTSTYTRAIVLHIFVPLMPSLVVSLLVMRSWWMIFLQGIGHWKPNIFLKSLSRKSSEAKEQVDNMLASLRPNFSLW